MESVPWMERMAGVLNFLITLRGVVVVAVAAAAAVHAGVVEVKT